MITANCVVLDCAETDDDTYWRVKAKVKVKNPEELSIEHQEAE